jgi:hypothetical protein
MAGSPQTNPGLGREPLPAPGCRRGARTCGTSSTPRREHTAGCDALLAAAESLCDMRAREGGNSQFLNRPSILPEMDCRATSLSN